MIGLPCRTVKVALRFTMEPHTHIMRTLATLAVSLDRGTLPELPQQV